MKRKLIAILLLIAVLLPLSALPEGWYLRGQRLDQHGEVLWGFLPTYVEGGGGYRGAPLIDGHMTSYEVILGGGYLQRKLWQDPKTGGVDRYATNPLTYDVGVFNWSFEMRQGFFSSPIEDNDMLYVWAEYRGLYEKAIDSMVAGKSRSNYTSATVSTLDGYLGANYDGSIFPDLAGDHQYLGNSIAFGLKFDYMVDTVETMDGVLAELSFEWGPSWANGALDGKAAFYNITFDIVGAKTLYQYKSAKDFHWFSIQIIDRVRLNYTSGDKVPVYMQRLGSLGRMVRGFNSYSYASEFTAVNNFEFRFTGPMLGVSWLYPRAALFLDLGYGGGHNYNTDITASNFVATTGFQLSIGVFDFLDLGFTYTYLIKGKRFNQDDSNLSFQFMFFLDY